jgi:hypothetical protein
VKQTIKMRPKRKPRARMKKIAVMEVALEVVMEDLPEVQKMDGMVMVLWMKSWNT